MTEILFKPITAAGFTDTTSIDLPDWAPDIYKIDTTTSPKNIYVWGTTTSDFLVLDCSPVKMFKARRFRIAADGITKGLIIQLRYRTVGELERT